MTIRDRVLAVSVRVRVAVTMASALGLVAISVSPASAEDTVAGREWALTQFNAVQIRTNLKLLGDGVTVAVVDSGVDPSQPDLAGSLLPGENFTDPAHPTSDTKDLSQEYHGTDVASIIAAHAHGGSDDLQGMIGLAPHAKILPIEDGVDGGSSASVAAAIRYAAEQGVRVINLSAGDTGGSAPAVSSAIGFALSRNIVVVAAGGNDGEQGNAPSVYATTPGVIDVASVQQNGSIDPQSHYGGDVTVAAPGVLIEEPGPNGTYNQGSGSSLAAPWVSALAALLIQDHPTWTAGQVVRAIIDNTRQGTGARLNDHFGYGTIDPYKALQAAPPTDTSNPLGGPAAGNPGTNPQASVPASGAAPTSTAAPTKSSADIALYIGVGIAVIVVIAILSFLLSRGKNGRGNGPGSGGGGGGGTRYPSQPSSPGGGQHAVPEPPRAPVGRPYSVPARQDGSPSRGYAPESTVPPQPYAPPQQYPQPYGGQGQPPQQR